MCVLGWGVTPVKQRFNLLFSSMPFSPVVVSLLLCVCLPVCVRREVHFSRILTGLASLKCVYVVTGFVVRIICLRLNKSAKKLCIKPKNI